MTLEEIIKALSKEEVRDKAILVESDSGYYKIENIETSKDLVLIHVKGHGEK